jgi:hypothetical protein
MAMVLVVALLVFFCVVGLAARRFTTSVRWLLLAGIAIMVAINFMTHALP